MGPPAFRPDAMWQHMMERRQWQMAHELMPGFKGLAQRDAPSDEPRQALPFFGPWWEIGLGQLDAGNRNAHEGMWYFLQAASMSGRHWWSAPDPRFPWGFPDFRPPDPYALA